MLNLAGTCSMGTDYDKPIQIALAGLILQILSFLFFTALLFRFGWRAYVYLIPC